LNAHLVFLDETGFLMTPLVCRTWAPRSQTPVFYQRGGSYQKLSCIGALAVPPSRKPEKSRPNFIWFVFNRERAGRAEKLDTVCYNEIMGP
jgi:hypothetical protein